MVEPISSSQRANPLWATNTQNSNKTYDIHNISPTEMDDYSLSLFNSGQINLKQRLAFVPLKTDQLDKSTSGTSTAQIQYRQRVWSDPDRKRDMLTAWKQTLQDQMAGGADSSSLQITRDAIRLLEALDKQNFKQTLAGQ